MPDKPTIIIIDDENAIRQPLADVLLLEGYPVLQASNGAEGIKQAKSVDHAIVLCDYKMSPMNGFAVAECLQIDEDTKKYPFVLITAMPEPRIWEDAKALGIVHVLAKPFRLNEVLALVESLQ